MKHRQLVETPATGFTISPGSRITKVILRPAGGLASGTLNMPEAPDDGQVLVLVSTQAVAALTQQSLSGVTIVGALTALVANVPGIWSYCSADQTWYPG